MRRSLSLVLVAAMLFSMVVFAVPGASAATTEPSLDWGNAAATAYYYPGLVNYYEVSGDTPANAQPSEDYVEIKFRGNTTDDVINLDGTIEEGEWGAPALTLSSDYASQFSGTPGKKNPDYSEPSKENTYYHKYQNAPSSTIFYEMNFTAYFLWDEQFLYLAVDTLDRDGHLNTKTSATQGAWNGDAVQFRIDPDGPNSIVDGEGYDGKLNAYPWRRQQVNGWDESYSEFPNFIVSLTQPLTADITGSRDAYVERWDAAKRYNVEETPGEGGDPTLVGSEADVAYGAEIGNESLDPVYASVTTKNERTSDFPRATRTQYEIAIPWKYIDSAEEVLSAGGFQPEVGMQLGMALALMNGPRGGSGYTSYLEWGNGITRDATYSHWDVAGGSNCLILDGTSYKDADVCTHETFAEPTCESGYKCTNCGYEKGHDLGHQFEYSEASMPTETTTGRIVGRCTREGCGYWVEKTIPETKFETVGSFTEDQTNLTMMPDYFDIAEDEASKVGWTKTWTEANGSPYRDPETGATRNAYEIMNGEAVANLTMLKYTGTTFYGDEVKDMFSYAQSMDIYMTGYSFPSEDDPDDANTNNMVGESGYTSGVYLQFGGDGYLGKDYEGGLFYIPETDQYYFAVIDLTAPGDPGKLHTEEDLENAALAYNKVDKELATEILSFETWHNLKIAYDDTTQTAFVYWDDELMIAAFAPVKKFVRGSESDMRDGTYPDQYGVAIMRTFDLQMYVKNVIVERLDPGEEIPDREHRPGTGDTYTATINGVAQEYAAGEEVTLTAEAFYEENSYAYRFAAWTGDVDTVVDVSANQTTFTMPERDVTIDAEYLLIGDAKVDGRLDMEDVLYIAQIAAGNRSEIPEGDVDGDGIIGPSDMTYINWYLAGNWIPSK